MQQSGRKQLPYHGKLAGLLLRNPDGAAAPENEEGSTSFHEWLADRHLICHDSGIHDRPDIDDAAA